uniref:WH1 domain-containing protein n=1 Tax=Steinernema glaseri TaxID=37863 RepID=A0A1I7Z053_9BILA
MQKIKPTISAYYALLYGFWTPNNPVPSDSIDRVADSIRSRLLGCVSAASDGSSSHSSSADRMSADESDGQKASSLASSLDGNVGSRLLDDTENARVFEALGDDSRALSSGLGRLFTVERRIGWDPLLFGVVCSVRELRHQKVAVSVVSPGDFDPINPETPHVMIEIPVGPEVEFISLAENFVVFASEGVGYGIEFVDETEATVFVEAIDLVQKERRLHVESQKEARDEPPAPSCPSVSSWLSSCSSVASTERLTKRPLSLVVPQPRPVRRAAVQFPPPPVKKNRELRCSFHRHDEVRSSQDEIGPATPKPAVRIARFSAQKFVDVPRDRKNKGRKEFFAS